MLGWGPLEDSDEQLALRGIDRVGSINSCSAGKRDKELIHEHWEILNNFSKGALKKIVNSVMEHVDAPKHGNWDPNVISREFLVSEY